MLDGIQKRVERLLDRNRLAWRLREILQGDRPADAEIPALESQLTEVRRRIDRGVQAILGGSEDLLSIRAALAELERRRARLEAQLGTARAPQRTEEGDLNRTVAAILAEPDDVRDVPVHGEPEQRRELVRRFLAGIRIERTTRQAVLHWYDLPRPPADSIRLVELRGDLGDGVRVETLALPRSGRARSPR